MDHVDIEGFQSEGGDDHVRTAWTATAHIITAVIGAGVLAVPWSVAQLGWLFGPIVLILFACITYYTAILLSNCYRYPDKVTGRRNRVYMDAVTAILGPKQKLLCGSAQHVVLCGALIGYTITTAKSMIAVKKSNCYYKHGRDAECQTSGNIYMLVFGVLEIILAQLPNLEKVTFLSFMAATMSFAYSFIGLGLCTAKLAENQRLKGTLTGIRVGNGGISAVKKTWSVFQALGNIAASYSYSVVLIEIQDTLRSPPPEHDSMKRANLSAIAVTTVFYVTLGCIGYAAFGNSAPGNFLTGFGFYEPYWLIDIGNICIVIHLVGAYQVYAQPVFPLIENWVAARCPSSSIFAKVYRINMPTANTAVELSALKLLSRSVFIVLITTVAMVVPFFNEFIGLLGAVTFYPLTVYFPVSMYMVQDNVERGSSKWLTLKLLDFFALVVCLLAAVGSVAGIVDSLRHDAPFKSVH
ncbi:amino acid permease 8-like isoform X2 [Nymphaea colorata]|uniref:amino acid permease 8-like isoform X2 n=1 Tax=Nymphaea colorata TaxID=210225 RepID=UPI00214EC02C|nr:amino acid permease 8-like isoform X2 [Nymphaea colorata]